MEDGCFFGDGSKLFTFHSSLFIKNSIFAHRIIIQRKWQHWKGQASAVN